MIWERASAPYSSKNLVTIPQGLARTKIPAVRLRNVACCSLSVEQPVFKSSASEERTPSFSF